MLGLCALDAVLPVQTPRTLSNGETIMTPTMARDFETLIVFGKMKNEPVAKLLSEHKLYPLQVNLLGKTFSVGAVSFFDYQQSDMGQFREIYMVVVATKKKMSPLKSIGAIVKALRPSKGAQDSDLVLFHLKAFSSSTTGVLSSRELWKIDSELSSVTMKKRGPWLAFTHEPQGEASVTSSFNLNSFTKLPLASNYNLDASGPAYEGVQAFSHVISCSEASYTMFDPKHHVLNVNRDLKELFAHFSFTPWIVEYSPHSQAIQFNPRSP